MSLKILQVSNRVPFPLNEGGTIGIYNYTRGFAEAGCTVTLIAQDAKKHKTNLPEAKAALSPYCDFHVYPVNTDINAIDAFLNLFSKSSYNVNRFYDPIFDQKLKDLLNVSDFDIVQIEGTFPAIFTQTIKENFKGPIILRQHNVEYQIWERLAQNSQNPIKKWYLNLLARRLKQFESQHLNQYEALVPVTPEDGQLFQKLGCKAPVFPSPSGINIDLWKPSYSSENKHYIYHIGSLEWMPNLEAVEWFLKDIWPEVLKRNSKMRFYVAGKGMPNEWLERSDPGVIFAGEVASAQDFIRDKNISVVPLKSGSGIRLKILEAMSAGKLVISTTIGAQGINYTKDSNVIIADSPSAFVASLVDYVSNEEKAMTVKQNGRLLIENEYANSAVINRLLKFYNGVVNQFER